MHMSTVVSSFREKTIFTPSTENKSNSSSLMKLTSMKRERKRDSQQKVKK